MRIFCVHTLCFLDLSFLYTDIFQTDFNQEQLCTAFLAFVITCHYSNRPLESMRKQLVAFLKDQVMTKGIKSAASWKGGLTDLQTKKKKEEREGTALCCFWNPVNEMRELGVDEDEASISGVQMSRFALLFCRHWARQHEFLWHCTHYTHMTNAAHQIKLNGSNMEQGKQWGE